MASDRSSRILRAGIGVLAILGLGIAVYVTLDTGAKGTSAPVIRQAPLLPGDTLRAAFKDLKGTGVVRAPAPCWLAFVVDPMCRECVRLADRLTARSEQNRVYWLVAGQSARIAAFVSGHGILADHVLRFPGDRRGLDILGRLGIRGTPTRLVLDSSFMIRDMRLAETIPSGPEHDSLCTANPRRPAGRSGNRGS